MIQKKNLSIPPLKPGKTKSFKKKIEGIEPLKEGKTKSNIKPLPKGMKRYIGF
jgi:hypothetical protein